MLIESALKMELGAALRRPVGALIMLIVTPSAAEASIPVWRLRGRTNPLEPTPPGPGLAVGRVCVPVKSAGQQAVLMLHRTRALPIRQQTMLANAFRARICPVRNCGCARHQACVRTDRESFAKDIF